MTEGETTFTHYKAVCREGDCDGINSMPYLNKERAKSDMWRHQEQHNRNGVKPDVDIVEVEKPPEEIR